MLMLACFLWVLPAAPLHGFALWFDVSFGKDTSKTEIRSESSMDSTVSGEYSRAFGDRPQRTSQDQIILSTAPEETPTHWAQVCRMMCPK